MNTKTRQSGDEPRPKIPAGEETIASLFQPDVLMADQYFENCRRKIPSEPERSLMLAVLEDGIRGYQDHIGAHGGREETLFEESREWLFSDDTDYLFAFVSICDVLGFDAQYIRRGLKRWEGRVRSDPSRPATAELLVA